MPHHVLISNDDGVHAAGIHALAAAFHAAGWQVSVVAPDGDRSATSHSLTIKKPLVVTPHAWPSLPIPVHAVTDGTPADCVKLGIRAILPAPPDLVASGINHGWNAGTDVHYSGTVGAAMDGAFEGVPALAVSAKHATPAHLAHAASLAVTIAGRILRTPTPGPAVVNLNLPGCDPADIRGLVEAPLTHIAYTDVYDRMDRSGGRAAYWLRGEIIEEACDPDGDLAMLAAGYATLTVLGWDLSKMGAGQKYLQDIQ